MPDLDSGLELALSFLTATGIALLVAAHRRARHSAAAKALEARGDKLAQRWNEEHYRTPEDQVLNYATFMLDTLGRSLSWNPGLKRMLGYEKAEFIGLMGSDLYPPEVLTGALSAPGVAYEAEVTANWARRDFADLAARVSVPVEFSVAEHESVWESGPEAVGAITALFTAAPRIVINEMADSGHNLSVGLTAGEYHQRVLSFISACVTAATGSAPAEGPVKSEVEA